MTDLLKLIQNLMKDIPSTVEINGKKFDVQLVPVKEEEMFDTEELVSAFNNKVDNIDPEIWDIAIEIFGNKYNAQLFDELINSEKLNAERFDQLKNAITAFNACIVDAANARINYLTDKYINGLRAEKSADEAAC